MQFDIDGLSAFFVPAAATAASFFLHRQELKERILNAARVLLNFFGSGSSTIRFRDLINASSCHPGACAEGRYINEFPGGATPSSPDIYMRRHIGAGFFTEWGDMSYYGGNFDQHYPLYYSSELTSDGRYAFSGRFPEGYSGVSRKMNTYPVHIGYGMLCTSP